MPEVPDLEAIRKFFNRTVAGETIERVDTLIPVVIRVPREEFVRLLTGDTLGEVHRHGKFLLFTLASGRIMVVNAMLTGRFSLAEPKAKRHARTCFALALSGGKELRYADQRLMGRVYLATPETLEALPQFAEMGPDVLSPTLTATTGSSPASATPTRTRSSGRRASIPTASAAR
jgi:formamidopyrimidine-DNA glycosylase